MTRIIKRIRNIIKEKNGETIAETLVALLITVLALMLLPGAIVAAARVNNRVENQTTYVNTDKGVSVGGTLRMTTDGISSDTITMTSTIKKYTEETGGKSIYYYD